MKKTVSFTLFLLLLCHMLAHVIAGLSAWWQEKHDLSERLTMYRSVDSVVEFQIPLKSHTDGSQMARTTADGFRYKGHYYGVISLEVRSDTLFIASIEASNHSLWQADLLSFLNDHLAASSDTSRKANQLLKFLLKEYSPSSRTILHFLAICWRESVRIPDAPIAFSTRTAPIHSPPPELFA